MEDNATDPSDVNIEPSVRQVSTVEPQVGLDSGIGVLSQFSGILSGNRPDSVSGPGPALSYLTLGPLVFQHIDSSTSSETTVEQIQPGSTEGTNEETSEKSAESMTVRELLQRENTQSEHDTDSGRPDRDAEIRELEGRSSDSSETHQLTVERTAQITRLFDDSARRQSTTPGSDESGADASSGSDGGHTPRDGYVPDEHGASTSSGDSRQQSMPFTVLDRSPASSVETGASESNRGTTNPQPGSAIDREDRTGTTSTDDGMGGESVARVDTNRPEPSPGSASTDAGSEPSLTVHSPERPPRRTESDQETAAQSPPHSSAPADPEQSVQSESSRQSTSEPDSHQTGQVNSADGQLPVVDFDEVPRPTLDRFVEQLSDELARHERIERERRGL